MPFVAYKRHFLGVYIANIAKLTKNTIYVFIFMYAYMVYIHTFFYVVVNSYTI